MGYIELADVSYALPGGWLLFEGVSFRVPEGEHAALVGANGIGKSTLLRLIVGDERPASGSVQVDGRVGLMRQFIGSDRRPTSVRDFLLAYAERPIAEAAARVAKAERWMHDHPSEDAQLRYAEALTHWGDVGGYEAEVLFDLCTHAAFGEGYPECAERRIETLSGGERKRLALEMIFRSPFDTILLDEPDNTLDIEGKTELEDRIRASDKTILFVSHDRTVLDRTATRVVTLEGKAAWVHPDGYATYAQARDARLGRLDEEHRRYQEERSRLTAMVKEMKRKAAYNDGWAKKARSAEHRLERFDVQKAPPTRPETQDVRMRIAGGRTGKIAFRAQGLAIADIVGPFDTEIWFGERIGVIGPNGSGKSHVLRLLSGEPIPHEGAWKLGARVEPALFAQLHERPDLADIEIVTVLRKRGLTMNEAMGRLTRYELDRAARNPFGLLSGGQQARFQILLMEIDSPTMLLLDEPTDNLDVASADALEEAIRRYQGTVIAVTHDRWFMRMMDRFLFFEKDGSVRELLESPYEDAATLA
ncbi:MAG TPA: ATP-binding cassette domain-containing protein [Actinomycetota bacterium]|nr:ATP-binding cassette domain-containing protein [Actinomycetota bacterium]